MNTDNMRNRITSLTIILGFIFATAHAYIALSTVPVSARIQQITEDGLYPYITLLLCIIFFISRPGIKESLRTGKYLEPSYGIGGIALIVLAVITPGSTDLPYMIFKIMLGYVGVFFLMSGKNAILSLYLVSIYGFAVAFPPFAEGLITDSFLQFISWITAGIASFFIPVTLLNNTIQIISITDERIVILINAACTGVAAMALFIAIFGLMMADIPLRAKDAAVFFILGTFGTFLQNIIRLVVLALTAYYFGDRAVTGVHEMIGYILFGAYFMLFAFLYLKKAKQYSSSTT